MKISAVILALAVAAEVAHADIFRNDFLPVGHVRTDAIIDPDCLSDHVHSFYGPPLLYPKVTFDDLRNSDPSLSSGNIEQNNSLYWHPAAYHVAENGMKTLQESEMTTVYYRWVSGKTTAFPPGFRMITPGHEVFEEGRVPGEREMEFGISFPGCWDGVNLDSPDHMSHVAFQLGEEYDAPCPSTHPVRIPQLDFFIRFFNTKPAKWRFSDGSTRFHGDYISGWDESFLQLLLDGDVDSRVTFRAGLKHEGDDQELIKQLIDNAVPKADTTCITTEVIDKVVNLPSKSCTGTLISPIGVCEGSSAPTPTAPTSPTTPAPTPTASPPTPSCQDSPLKFKQGRNRKWRTCSWVADRKNQRCRSPSHASHCPSLCEQCEEFECADSKKVLRVWSAEHDEMIRGKCFRLVEDDTDLCDDPEFAQTCREQCGYCE